MTFHENPQENPDLNQTKPAQDGKRIQHDSAVSYSNNEELMIELEKTLEKLQKLQKQLQKQILGKKLRQELEQESGHESEQELEQKQKQGQLQSDIDKVTFGNIGNNKVIVFVQPVD